MSRNHGLDLLKVICAFMIICIHVPFPGLLGEIITPLTRIAVLIFFMISGYYYSYIKERQKEKKQIIKIFKLLMSANLLYFFWSLAWTFIKGDSITAYISNVLSLESIYKFIVFNESPFGGHLWYLGSILYVLLIVFAIEIKWTRKVLYPLIPILLLTDLVFGKYSVLLFGTTFPYIFVRNFLFVGLPYFLIGDLLNIYKIKIKNSKALLLSLLFVVTTFIEKFALVYFDVNADREHYISTTFLAVCVFLWANNLNIKDNRKLTGIICYVGANLSTYIYIIHPIFITIMSAIMNYVSRYIGFDMVYNYMEPFLILLVTAFVSWVYYITVIKAKSKLTRRGKI